MTSNSTPNDDHELELGELVSAWHDRELTEQQQANLADRLDSAEAKHEKQQLESISGLIAELADQESATAANLTQRIVESCKAEAQAPQAQPTIWWKRWSRRTMAIAGAGVAVCGLVLMINLPSSELATQSAGMLEEDSILVADSMELEYATLADSSGQRVSTFEVERTESDPALSFLREKELSEELVASAPAIMSTEATTANTVTASLPDQVNSFFLTNSRTVDESALVAVVEINTSGEQPVREMMEKAFVSNGFQAQPAELARYYYGGDTAAGYSAHSVAGGGEARNSRTMGRTAQSPASPYAEANVSKQKKGLTRNTGFYVEAPSSQIHSLNCEVQDRSQTFDVQFEVAPEIYLIQNATMDGLSIAESDVAKPKGEHFAAPFAKPQLASTLRGNCLPVVVDEFDYALPQSFAQPTGKAGSEVQSNEQENLPGRQLAESGRSKSRQLTKNAWNVRQLQVQLVPDLPEMVSQNNTPVMLLDNRLFVEERNNAWGIAKANTVKRHQRDMKAIGREPQQQHKKDSSSQSEAKPMPAAQQKAPQKPPAPQPGESKTWRVLYILQTEEKPVPEVE